MCDQINIFHKKKKNIKHPGLQQDKKIGYMGNKKCPISVIGI